MSYLVNDTEYSTFGKMLSKIIKILIRPLHYKFELLRGYFLVLLLWIAVFLIVHFTYPYHIFCWIPLGYFHNHEHSEPLGFWTEFLIIISGYNINFILAVIIVSITNNREKAEK